MVSSTEQMNMANEYMKFRNRPEPVISAQEFTTYGHFKLIEALKKGFQPRDLQEDEDEMSDPEQSGITNTWQLCTFGHMFENLFLNVCIYRPDLIKTVLKKHEDYLPPVSKNFPERGSPYDDISPSSTVKIIRDNKAPTGKDSPCLHRYARSVGNASPLINDLSGDFTSAQKMKKLSPQISDSNTGSGNSQGDFCNLPPVSGAVKSRKGHILLKKRQRQGSRVDFGKTLNYSKSFGGDQRNHSSFSTGRFEKVDLDDDNFEAVARAVAKREKLKRRNFCAFENVNEEKVIQALETNSGREVEEKAPLKIPLAWKLNKYQEIAPHRTLMRQKELSIEMLDRRVKKTMINSPVSMHRRIKSWADPSGG